MAHSPEPEVRFSPREIEVLRAMCHGLQAKEIAHLLRLAINTVNCYRDRIFLKLAVKSAPAAVFLAVLNPTLLVDGTCHRLSHRPGCDCQTEVCQALRRKR